MLLVQSKRSCDGCWGFAVSWKGVRRTQPIKISSEFAFGDSTIDSIYILKVNFLIAPVIVLIVSNRS